MEILRALGVDWTLFVHMGCFAISYIFLTTFVLKPYTAALREREKRTIGNEEHAFRMIEEAEGLQAQYEQKAKAINTQIKGYFDESRSKAMAQYDQLVQKARAEATTLLTASRTKIETEVQSARKTLTGEIPSVSAAMASKLAGKEISL